MQPIRVAFIGCGKIADKHAAALASMSEAHLVAVADLSAERRTSAESRWQVPAFEDWRQMVAETNPDIVTILTPSGSHASLGRAVAESGCHLIIEKPMALTLEDADALIGQCDANGVRAFVVKQNRFNRPIRLLRAALDDGRFGKMVLGTVRVRWCRPQAYYDQDRWRGTWAMDGGVLSNQASHHIDMLQWLMGPVEAVTAYASTRLVQIEAEETATVMLRFRSGALGIIEATTATRPKDLEGSLSLLGEHGAVEVGGFYMNDLRTWQFDHEHPLDGRAMGDEARNPAGDPVWGHRAYLRGVCQALRGEASDVADAREGRKSVALISAMYASIEQQREIRLADEPFPSRLGRA